MKHPSSPPDPRRKAHAVPDAPAASVQSRGGIGQDAASAAGDEPPRDTGWARGAVDVPGPSLADDGDDAEAHDGRAHHGFTGDDGGHLATDSTGVPAAGGVGDAADLGRGHDRRHGISDDPAERTTGGDRPNVGDRLNGAPGGPRPTVPAQLPGEDTSLADDADSAAHGGEDATRDQQI